MDKILYPTRPVRFVKTRPSNVGKSVFLTSLILIFITDSDKIYIYSPSLLQDIYRKIFKCFSICKPVHIIPNILNEEDIDVVIEEIVNDKNFEKSDTEKETNESIEELKFPQEYEDGGNIILEDLDEKEMNDPRVQAMFKRSRHNKLFFLIISQDYYELPERTIRANGNIYQIFKPDNFFDFSDIYQDKTFMDMTLDKFKYINSTCRDKQNQPLTIDMTKDKYTGRFRLGLNSLFVPNSSSF